jgi:antirestriction protein ArdC
MTDEDFYRQFENKFYQLTMSGKAPWLKEGKVEREVAYNPSSGIVFKGINSMMLEMSAAERGFKDSRWLSGEEVKQLGFTPRYGERPTVIGYINKYIHPVDVNPATGKTFDTHNPKQKYYFMYNVEQLKEYKQLRERSKAISREIITEKIKNTMENAKSNKFNEITERLGQMTARNAPEHTALIASVTSQYRLAQEFKARYSPPISIESFKNSVLRAKNYAIIRSIYQAEIAKDRLISRNQELDRGAVRTVERIRQQGRDFGR